MQMLLSVCVAMWAIDDQGQPTHRGSPLRSALRSRNGRTSGASSRTPSEGSPSRRPAPACRRSLPVGFYKPRTCAEVKTNKHKTLLLVRSHRDINSHDLVRKYDYSPGTARSYLSHLGRQGLLAHSNGRYRLTEKGHGRIRYFAIFGCRRPGCPLCLGKLGHLTCPNCEHRIPIGQAIIEKKKDYLLAARPAGIYCGQCMAIILDEAQARRMGIRSAD